MPDPTIRETIEETAKGPASTSLDGVSVQQQDISKQIEADRYLAGKSAAASRKTGLRIFTIKGNSPT